MREAAFRFKLWHFLATAAVVGAFYLAAHRYSAGSPTRQARLGEHVGIRTDLVASSGVVDLGILPQGVFRAEVFSLTNTGRAPVTIKAIRTSCDCAVVKVARSVLKPNETALASAAIDLRRSGEGDDFTGGLSIEVVGIDSAGAEAFAIELRAQVMAPDAFEQATRDGTGKPLIAFASGRAP